MRELINLLFTISHSISIKDVLTELMYLYADLEVAISNPLIVVTIRSGKLLSPKNSSEKIRFV